MAKSLLPIFMISGLTFKSLIHFEFFSNAWYEKVVQFNSFAYNWSVFPIPFIEEAVFSSIIWSCLCHRLTAHLSEGSFLGSPFDSTDLSVCFCTIPTLFQLLWFYSVLWNLRAWYLRVCSSFSRVLQLVRVFCVSTHIFELFVLVLWKVPLVFWQGLHWICTLP